MMSPLPSVECLLMVICVHTCLLPCADNVHMAAVIHRCADNVHMVAVIHRCADNVHMAAVIHR